MMTNPNINTVTVRIKIILKFEKPKVFKESKSVLDLIEKKYHIEPKKTIKGSNFIIIFGMYMKVRKMGIWIPISKSLKNSISSKRFNITPRQIKIKILVNFKNHIDNI